MGQVVLQVGQVWNGMVPFSDDDKKAKHRPVVILGWAGLNVTRGDAHILVVPSSTFEGDPAKARLSDLKLKDWRVAGLSADSFIQCARIWSLAPAAIDFTSGLRGSLDAADLHAVMSEVSKLFSVSGFATV